MKEAMFYEIVGKKIHCFLCPHNCVIPVGKRGLCNVRENIDQKLYSLIYGRITAKHIDPIEKKPLFHFLPGSTTFSIATMGCNFRCSFCQNWMISQAGENLVLTQPEEITPEAIVKEAIKCQSPSISFTYTEPTIFFEFAYDTAKIARENKLMNIFISNGFISEQALEKISPLLGACNIDLKSFREKFYKNICGGCLKPVLDAIKYLKKKHIWVELTTLLIPGLNDSVEELNDIAAFIAEISPYIPWHISRFYPDYRLKTVSPTPDVSLDRAVAAAKSKGLKFIYKGNIIGRVDTRCPGCGEVLLERHGNALTKSNLVNGKCFKCERDVEGVWNLAV